MTPSATVPTSRLQAQFPLDTKVCVRFGRNMVEASVIGYAMNVGQVVVQFQLDEYPHPIVTSYPVEQIALSP